MAKRHKIRKEFYNSTSNYWKNLNGKPSIKYVKWLEDKIMREQQVKKLNINNVSNCCPNCDSVDIEISKRCNECSAHFD